MNQSPKKKKVRRVVPKDIASRSDHEIMELVLGEESDEKGR